MNHFTALKSDNANLKCDFEVRVRQFSLDQVVDQGSGLAQASGRLVFDRRREADCVLGKVKLLEKERTFFLNNCRTFDSSTRKTLTDIQMS